MPNISHVKQHSHPPCTMSFLALLAKFHIHLLRRSTTTDRSPSKNNSVSKRKTKDITLHFSTHKEKTGAKNCSRFHISKDGTHTSYCLDSPPYIPLCLCFASLLVPIQIHYTPNVSSATDTVSYLHIIPHKEKAARTPIGQKGTSGIFLPAS